MTKIKQNKGFTLLEILLVIAAIGILAAIVLVAINPNRQIALGNNARRSSDVGTIYKAIQQYNIDNQRYPEAIENMQTGYDNRKEICRVGEYGINCIDIDGDIVPIYIASIPEDPNSTTVISTRYSIVKNLNNTIAVRAEGAELGREIIAGVILDGGGTLNAPSAITDLSIQVIDGISVSLTWSAPNSPLPIEEYVIIYSSGQGFSSQTVIGEVLSTSYLVENLPIGIYEFKVVAVNAEAQGPDSNIVEGVLCGAGTCIDYAGADWIISSNQNISGLHYNVGIFRVNTGIMASTVLGERFVVHANQYQGLGNIDASGRGYRGGRDGHSGNNGLGIGGGTQQYAGGGYGGAGGGSGGGIGYGSIEQPIELGSGGGSGYYTNTLGGRGGGAIKIVVSGDIEVGGNILANGGNGASGGFYSGGGGGAGGSVWLEAGGEMRGAGEIRVNGGNGVGGSAGGAGGRIAMYYGSNSFSGTVTTNGGNVTSGSGGAGTIFQQQR
jgi:prepilin-type N-terminal cleavage/methylation domain-containing protein